jgi:hypothetical protein
MKYKQINAAPTNYHPSQVHAVREDDSALCGRIPKYGWDPYEFKKEEVNCKMCQRYSKILEKKPG